MTHTTAFAGIYGAVATLLKAPVAETAQPAKEEATVVIDPAGIWGMSLKKLTPDMAQMLLQILRDVSPPATQVDGTLIRRVVSYDEELQRNEGLMQDIERGLAGLDVLARKLTRQRYLEIGERTLRRSMLTQMSHLQLFSRLGVQTHIYASTAV